MSNILDFLNVNGKVAQIASSSTTTPSTVTSVIPADDTIPQNSEGDELLTIAVAPKYAGSDLIIEAIIPGEFTASFIAAIFKDSDADAIASTMVTPSSNGALLRYTVAAVNVTSRTYKLRVGVSSGTAYVNQSASFDLGETINSTLSVTEVIK